MIHNESYSHTELVALKRNDLTIIPGYKSTKYPKSKFQSCFNDYFSKLISENESDKKIMELGDFNLDILNGRNITVTEFFASFGTASNLPLNVETTNLKSRINIIFSNIYSVKA